MFAACMLTCIGSSSWWWTASAISICSVVGFLCQSQFVLKEHHVRSQGCLLVLVAPGHPGTKVINLNFIVVLSDLNLCDVDTRVKRGTELRTALTWCPSTVSRKMTLALIGSFAPNSCNAWNRTQPYPGGREVDSGSAVNFETWESGTTGTMSQTTTES